MRRRSACGGDSLAQVTENDAIGSWTARTRRIATRDETAVTGKLNELRSESVNHGPLGAEVGEAKHPNQGAAQLRVGAALGKYTKGGNFVHWQAHASLARATRNANMTYVIAEPCIGVKDRACVDVCPVDCIYEGEDMLYIHPDECIDCGACVPECPVSAIFVEEEVPAEWASFIAKNRDVFAGSNPPGRPQSERGAR